MKNLVFATKYNLSHEGHHDEDEEEITGANENDAAIVKQKQERLDAAKD